MFSIPFNWIKNKLWSSSDPGPGSGHETPADTDTDQQDCEDEETTSTYQKTSGIGRVTRFVGGAQVDNTYNFDRQDEKFDCRNIRLGSCVEFTAERFFDADGGWSSWNVVSLREYNANKETGNEEETKHSTVIGKVIKTSKRDKEIVVECGSINNSLQMNIPFCYLPNYIVSTGDYLRIHLEQACRDAGDEYGTVRSKIIYVEPTKLKRVTAPLTRTPRGFICIDNHIFFTADIIRLDTPVGSIAKVTAVESEQDEFTWRAIEGKVVRYTNGKCQRNTDTDVEEDWSDNRTEDNAVLTTNCEFEHLFDNRNKSVVIAPVKYINFGDVVINDIANMSVELKNVSGDCQTLYGVKSLMDQTACEFTFQTGKLPLMISPLERSNVNVSCKPSFIGSTKDLVVFDFGSFKVARYLSVNATSNDDVAPTNSMERIERPQRPSTSDLISTRTANAHRKLIRGQQMFRSAFFVGRRIPNNSIPQDLWSIVKNKDSNLLGVKFPAAFAKLSFSNYKQRFQTALWFEEIAVILQMQLYNLDEVLVRFQREFVVFEVPNLHTMSPPVRIGDTVTAIRKYGGKDEMYSGTVCGIHNTELQVKFHDSFHEMVSKRNPNNPLHVSIQFTSSRSQFKRQHFAVENAVDFLKESFLFPTSSDFVIKPVRIPFIEDDSEDNEQEDAVAVPPESIANVRRVQNLPKRALTSMSARMNQRSQSINTPKGWNTQSGLESLQLRWFNPSLNSEQKDAVRRVLRGQGRPLPYIIYGPPGTGKSVTVVEAIMQIYALDPNSRILVTCPSNSAADLIAIRLVKSGLFYPGDFVRLIGYIRSSDSKQQLPELEKYYRDGDDLEIVTKHRIVITTCATAGQFLSLNLPDGFYSHVFIDEAGYCTEPEALISAELLEISKNGQLILSGDPNQLGPVLISQEGEKCGLAVSLLERLMALPMYSRDEKTFPETKYNPFVVTKLVRNYRSHGLLLRVPASLFYDNELFSCLTDKSITGLCQSQLLLKDVLTKHAVPLIFHGVKGNSCQEVESQSWFNANEIHEVLRYIRLLLYSGCGLSPDDIGVISPYRKQVEKLRSVYEVQGAVVGALPGTPKFGSVEEFQGGERKVVIISTVRSTQNDSRLQELCERADFIFSRKRFNVAITRAQALLIVVGNPHVLHKDKNWLELLNLCVDVGAYRGCDLPLELIARQDANLKAFRSMNEFCDSKSNVNMAIRI